MAVGVPLVEILAITSTRWPGLMRLLAIMESFAESTTCCGNSRLRRLTAKGGPPWGERTNTNNVPCFGTLAWSGRCQRDIEIDAGRRIGLLAGNFRIDGADLLVEGGDDLRWRTQIAERDKARTRQFQIAGVQQRNARVKQRLRRVRVQLQRPFK